MPNYQEIKMRALPAWNPKVPDTITVMIRDGLGVPWYLPSSWMGQTVYKGNNTDLEPIYGLSKAKLGNFYPVMLQNLCQVRWQHVWKANWELGRVSRWIWERCCKLGNTRIVAMKSSWIERWSTTLHDERWAIQWATVRESPCIKNSLLEEDRATAFNPNQAVKSFAFGT